MSPSDDGFPRKGRKTRQGFTRVKRPKGLCILKRERTLDAFISEQAYVSNGKNMKALNFLNVKDWLISLGGCKRKESWNNSLVQLGVWVIQHSCSRVWYLAQDKDNSGSAKEHLQSAALMRLIQVTRTIKFWSHQVRQFESNETDWRLF